MSSFVINAVKDGNGAGFDLIHNRIESLSNKMDTLINIQEKVLIRLDGMSHEIDDIEQDMETLKVDKEEIHISPKVMNQTQMVGREVRDICQEMSTIMSAVNQRSEQQAQKLEGMEKLVLSMQQVIGFVGEMVKNSKLMEMMFKGPATRKGSKLKESKGKQAIKRKSSADTIAKKTDKVRQAQTNNQNICFNYGLTAILINMDYWPNTLNTEDIISIYLNCCLLSQLIHHYEHESCFFFIFAYTVSFLS